MVYLSAALTSLVGLSAAAVTTRNGTVSGGKCSAAAANYYFSVPYAEPPIGDLRFAAPQPYNKKYNGTLKATTPPPACSQFGTQLVEDGPQSEDCLFLNIWTPQNATSFSKLPVKFWIYGGSEMTGGIADATYDGCFSATDSIVVSVNYRLGPLGFLSLQSGGLTGNYGISDILLGLQWVQENIGAFGGDPTKVLLFGQSAGADNTFYVSTLPQAASLINAAVMESGGGSDIPTLEEAEAWSQTFAKNLNCSISDVACLRSKTPQQLNETTMAMSQQYDAGNIVGGVATLHEDMGRGNTWGPIVDGKVIPTQPTQAGIRVPSIVGTTTNEGAVFVLGEFEEASYNLTQAQYDVFLTTVFGDLASAVNETYAVSKFAASPAPVFSAMDAVITASGYFCPAYTTLVGAARNNVPVWTYSFNHTPSCDWYSAFPNDPQFLEAVGATHTSEIPFVFGEVSNLPPPSGNCSFTAAEQKISSFLMNAWTSMARSGHPGAGWPQWRGNSSSGVLVNDAVSIGQVDYTVCASFWTTIFEKIAQEDANACTGQ